MLHSYGLNRTIFNGDEGKKVHFTWDCFITFSLEKMSLNIREKRCLENIFYPFLLDS